jgi:hypothetical protein
MHNAFIICVHLKPADNIGEHYARVYEELRREGKSRRLTISNHVEVKQGESPLPRGVFKVIGTASIDDINAIAISAARSGTPDFVAVFETKDSPESIRLSYHDRAIAPRP